MWLAFEACPDNGTAFQAASRPSCNANDRMGGLENLMTRIAGDSLHE